MRRLKFKAGWLRCRLWGRREITREVWSRSSQEHDLRRRYRPLLLLSSFFFILFCLVIGRFYHLQIVQGASWVKLADMQHSCYLNLPAKRGRFLGTSAIDGGPICLVSDRKGYHLYANPRMFNKADLEALSQAIAAQQCSLDQAPFLLSQFNHRDSYSRKLIPYLTLSEKIDFTIWWERYACDHHLPRRGLYFVADYRRSHPYGHLCGAVLHTVQELRDQDCHAIPTGGLELHFNTLLCGEVGRCMRLRSPHQSFEEGVFLSLPRDGTDIHLTIDPYVQAIAEEEIEKGVKWARAKQGWVVILDPETGEVICIAQYPFFDPTRYRDYYNDPALTGCSEIKPITYCFEPGSTMKPLAILIAYRANEILERKGELPLFDPCEKMSVQDGHFPGRKQPIKDVTGYHHFLNMDLAIQKSSNIYVSRVMQRVVDRLGSSWLRAQLVDLFHFGRLTGIELPGEVAGFVPTIGRTHPSGRLEWSKPTPFSLSMGYNLTVTTMQLLRAYAMIANGGFDVTPTLVKRIEQREATGQACVWRVKDRPPRERTVKAEAVQELVEALKLTIKKGGTSRRAAVSGYTEAGKSGTSEKLVCGLYAKRLHFCNFIGFAPANRPRFVVFVAIDEPAYDRLPGLGPTHMAGGCAAPVFSRVTRRVLEYVGEPADDPYGYPLQDPRSDEEQSDFYKRAQETRRLYQHWNR